MALNISLNGSNYVSEKTRGAFVHALQEQGGRTQETQLKLQELGNRLYEEGNGGKVVEKVESEQQMTGTGAQEASVAAGAILDSLDRALAQSYEHQTLTMRVHEQYLHNQSDYARIFSELMQQQGAIFSGSFVNGNGSAQHVAVTVSVLDTLSRSMTRFHDLQEQTLDVHRQFLAQQSEYAHAAIQLLQQQTGTAQIEASQAPDVGSKKQEAGRRTQDVGGKTLGVASKLQEAGRRMQAVGQMQDAGGKLPDSGNGGRAALAEMPVASLNNRVPVPSPILTAYSPLSIPTPDPAPAPSSSLTPSEDAVPSTSNSLLITSSLLAIVSDKTGYPADMLDLGMDMESDLGIDSIKRVEILGALQEAHPDLPEVPTEVLSEMRTLGQIVERLQGGSKTQVAEIPEPVGSAKKA